MEYEKRKEKKCRCFIKNNELVEKIIDLCLYYQIEDSHHWLRDCLLDTENDKKL